MRSLKPATSCGVDWRPPPAPCSRCDHHVEVRLARVARVEGHRTRLAMAAPRKKSAASFELSSSTATRSPGSRPRARSPFAIRQPRSQAAAKVSRSLPCTTASRPAKKLAARRIALVTSMALPLRTSSRRQAKMSARLSSTSGKTWTATAAAPGTRRTSLGHLDQHQHVLGVSLAFLVRHRTVPPQDHQAAPDGAAAGRSGRAWAPCRRPGRRGAAPRRWRGPEGAPRGVE